MGMTCRNGQSWPRGALFTEQSQNNIASQPEKMLGVLL